MHKAALACGSPSDSWRPRVNCHRPLCSFKCFVFRWISETGHNSPKLTLPPADHCHVGIAKPCGGLDHRVQHGLQIERRAADDLQHVADRGLVFQRFLKIARALADLSSSRAFSIAITACAAKFSSRVISLSEKG